MQAVLLQGHDMHVTTQESSRNEKLEQIELDWQLRLSNHEKNLKTQKDEEVYLVPPA